MTWEIVVGLISLVTVCIAIIKPIVELTKAITKLDASCSDLSRRLTDFDEDNAKSHKRIWEHNEEQDTQLQDHEIRIHDLEKKE